MESGLFHSDCKPAFNVGLTQARNGFVRFALHAKTLPQAGVMFNNFVELGMDQQIGGNNVLLAKKASRA